MRRCGRDGSRSRRSCLKNEKVKPEFNFPRSLHFKGANTLIGVSEFGQVLECDLTAKLSDDPKAAPPRGKTLFNVNPAMEGRHHIKCAEWTRGWAMARGRHDRKRRLPALGGRQARSCRFAWARTSSSGASRSTRPESDSLWASARRSRGQSALLHGRQRSDPRFTRTRPPRICPSRRSSPHAGRAEALAFHPQLDRLAVAGGDADEVTLLDLANTEKPCRWPAAGDGTCTRSTSPRTATSSACASRPEGGIARSQRPRRGGLDAVQSRAVHPDRDANVKWVGPIEQPGGWSVVPDAKSRYVWFAERRRADGSTERIRLGLDQYLDLRRRVTDSSRPRRASRRACSWGTTTAARCLSSTLAA